MNWFKTNRELIKENAILKSELAVANRTIAAKNESISRLFKRIDQLTPEPIPKKAPVRPVKASRTAPTPPSSLSNVDGLPERYSSSVRPEPSHDVGSFLVGMAVGAAVDSLFSSSNNDSSSSSSSSSDYSSGGGGDYGGGGASGDF